MSTISLILISTLVILLIIFLIIIFNLYNKISKNEANEKEENQDNLILISQNISESLKTLKHDLGLEIRETRKELDQKIYIGQKDMTEISNFQFQSSQKLIQDIHEHLGKVNQSVIEVKEGSKQVVNMAEQLSNLEKVLTNQKQRGNWGESSLQLILSNFLPEGVYKMQHGFQSGEIVDAVIFIRDKILCIDSKFSIDNYRRCLEAKTEEDKKYFADEFKKDMKSRIEETKKYINETEEKTLPFAFMFIPSEAIYYDLHAGDNGNLKINTQKLLDFAQEKKIIIVSPTSILAYLHLVISGIKDSKIEQNALEIKKKVEELGKHILKYEEYMQKLGNSLNTTVNHYNASYKELKKIDKDVYKISDGQQDLNFQPLLVDKVEMEE